MKNLLLIAAVMLLISLAGNWIQWRSAKLAQRDRNLEAKEFRNRQAEALTKITQRDTAIQALLYERAKDSVRHSQSQSVLKTRISALKKKIGDPLVFDMTEATGVNIFTHYDSIVDGVYWRDSVIVLQDALISDLEQERDTLYITDNQAIDSLQKSNNELKTMFSDQFKESIQLQGQLDREKKKRFSVGPHAGVDFRGATVGVSVQWSIWRF